MPFSRDYHDILVIEDNDDDFEATERALSKADNVRQPVRRCRDGLEAWQYLQGEMATDPRDRSRLPGLILLDLNMPGLDGRKFLARMKQDEALRPIPVVVMTTSNDSVDVRSCYDAGANTYVCKPVSWSEFNKAITRLREYWFDLAVLPHAERAP